MRLSVEARSPAYVTLTARPLRTGILVPDIPGLAWQMVFRGALATQVREWGGSGNFVLPLRADTKERDVFWALVELFDADWWGVYGGSHCELEELDASIYATWRQQLDHELAKWPPDDRSRALDEALATPFVDATIPDDLHELLVGRGATLNHEGRMLLRAPVSATGPPPYPSVDALALGGLPEEVLDVHSDGSPTRRLLLAAEFGSLSPDLRAELDGRGIARRSEAPSSSTMLMRWLYDIQTQPGSGPFSLAEVGLSWYRPRPFVEDTITIVAGEDAWDFALAYALRRARTHAYWLPSSAFESKLDRDVALRALAGFSGRTGSPLVVTSVSDDDAADELARAFAQQRYRRVVIRTAHWRESLPPTPNRLLVRNRLGRAEPLYLDDGATPHLRTPVPDLSDDPSTMRWMTEVEVRNWAPARHPSLAPNLLVDNAWGEARITRCGLAYQGVRGMVPFGVPLEQLTAEPSLRPLPLLEQLRCMAATSRWTCELSQRGQFALAASELLGGCEALCSALRDPDIGEVLHAYLAAGNGVPGLALGDRRRYLSLKDFGDLTLTKPPEDVVGALRVSGVVRPGLVLKCERCRHTDWYRPSDVDPTFDCTRCASVQAPSRNSWLGDAEPRWRYRLDEVVFQFARHRGDLPVLAAYEQFDRSIRTVQFVPEIDITTAAGQGCEVDFALTEGSSLWLGEAFSDRRYASSAKEELERLRRLAATAAVLNARGVVLATSANDIAPQTKARARTVFASQWPELRFMERAFHLRRPVRLLDDA
jgi:hypothetical protein